MDDQQVGRKIECQTRSAGDSNESITAGIKKKATRPNAIAQHERMQERKALSGGKVTLDGAEVDQVGKS